MHWRSLFVFDSPMPMVDYEILEYIYLFSIRDAHIPKCYFSGVSKLFWTIL